MPDDNQEDSDLTSLFEGCTFEDATFVNSVISKFPNATKLDYMFKNSDLTNASKIKPCFHFESTHCFTNTAIVP